MILIQVTEAISAVILIQREVRRHFFIKKWRFFQRTGDAILEAKRDAWSQLQLWTTWQSAAIAVQRRFRKNRDGFFSTMARAKALKPIRDQAVKIRAAFRRYYGIIRHGSVFRGGTMERDRRVVEMVTDAIANGELGEELKNPGKKSAAAKKDGEESSVDKGTTEDADAADAADAPTDDKKSSTGTVKSFTRAGRVVVEKPKKIPFHAIPVVGILSHLRRRVVVDTIVTVFTAVRARQKVEATYNRLRMSEEDAVLTEARACEKAACLDYAVTK